MKRTLRHVLPAAFAVALPLACLPLSASAGDEPGFHGYLRAGAGSSSIKGPQSCYSLGGNTMKYRLGNECDAYTEFGYTQALAKTDDGVTFLGTIWASAFSPKSDFGDAKLGIAKAYVEARGLDFLNGGSAWIGKRYYYRPDIHMLDLQYINLNGTGAGIDQVQAGPGKFSYAFFKDNDIVEQAANGTLHSASAPAPAWAAPAATASALPAAPCSAPTSPAPACSTTWRSSRAPTSAWNSSPWRSATSPMPTARPPGLRWACAPSTPSTATSSWRWKWAPTA